MNNTNNPERNSQRMSPNVDTIGGILREIDEVPGETYSDIQRKSTLTDQFVSALIDMTERDEISWEETTFITDNDDLQKDPVVKGMYEGYEFEMNYQNTSVKFVLLCESEDEDGDAYSLSVYCDGERTVLAKEQGCFDFDSQLRHLYAAAGHYGTVATAKEMQAVGQVVSKYLRRKAEDSIFEYHRSANEMQIGRLFDSCDENEKAGIIKNCLSLLEAHDSIGSSDSHIRKQKLAENIFDTVANRDKTPIPFTFILGDGVRSERKFTQRKIEWCSNPAIIARCYVKWDENLFADSSHPRTKIIAQRILPIILSAMLKDC